MAAVDVALVEKVLKPIWTKKTETASRVRGRIEAVLDWAKARGYRTGENPARWRGGLENLLPARSKVQRVQHHAALPYDQLGEFMAGLRTQRGEAARALEFTILTASRSGEVLGATWAEIDLGKGTWTIPATRIKAGREHRVPLSGRTLEILKAQAKRRDGSPFLFPGARKNGPLSGMAMLMLLRRMGRSDLTAHGFRSTFRDWAAEQTAYSREVCEQALAHAISNKVEAAYRRGDLFEKRQRLMADWAKFCGTVRKAGTVVRLRRA